jgi:hypothetical protein
LALKAASAFVKVQTPTHSDLSNGEEKGAEASGEKRFATERFVFFRTTPAWREG